MFLSRMSLDMSHEETQNLILSPQLQYAKIQDAFDSPEDAGHVLWRLDSIEGRLWLVLLSGLRPDLHAFHRACGYQGVFPSWQTIDYDSLLDDIDIRVPQPFSLCACPSAPLKSPQTQMQSPAYLRAWLRAQENAGGFSLVSLTLLTNCWKVSEARYLLFAWWEGMLRVNDTEKFRKMTQHGLGFGHHLGAGLLTLSDRDYQGF